jgi:acyl-CoA reductase-like NAD-dependent aldehyde dehydrogenase
MGSTTETQFFNIINDELRGSSESHQVTDPRTEEPLWPCPIATTDDFEEAVTAARNAFPAWSRSTVAERQAVLVKLADNIKEHSQELMEIVMKETGKSVRNILHPRNSHPA